MTSRVLNPAILNSSYINGYEGTLSRARQNLIENDLSVALQEGTGLYRVVVSGESPEAAQGLLEAVLDSLIENSTPTASRSALLELEL